MIITILGIFDLITSAVMIAVCVYIGFLISKGSLSYPFYILFVPLLLLSFFLFRVGIRAFKRQTKVYTLQGDLGLIYFTVVTGLLYLIYYFSDGNIALLVILILVAVFLLIASIHTLSEERKLLKEQKRGHVFVGCIVFIFLAIAGLTLLSIYIVKFFEWAW